jgi:hypothetical protein
MICIFGIGIGRELYEKYKKTIRHIPIIMHGFSYFHDSGNAKLMAFLKKLLEMKHVNKLSFPGFDQVYDFKAEDLADQGILDGNNK